MQQETIEKVEFVNSPEQLQEAMQRDANPVSEQAQEPVQQDAPVATEPTPEPVAQPEAPAQEQVEQPQQPEYSEPQTSEEPQYSQPQYSEQQIEGAVINFLSEKLGREINSLDDIAQPQQAAPLDERIDAIARFVQETGRAPQDWFAYQQLNPTEMDDVTAVRVDMASQYPNLSNEELGLLVQSKYKLDPEINTEEEVRLSQIQLKVDAANARQSIEKIRDGYAAPLEQQQAQLEPESFVNDEWVSNMSREVDALTGIEFDLGGGKAFTFGIDDQYREQLKNKNARLEEFFDPYVRQDGSWDYDMLSSHRTVIDRIDEIVSSVYKQGLSDGQKGVVENVANVQSKAPEQGNVSDTNPLTEQLRQIVGTSNKMTFNI